jgi:hypothetical protein
VLLDATRDRNRSLAIPKINRHKSSIGYQHRAILSQLPARLNLRQGQAAKAGPVPTHDCLGPDDCENLQNRRKPAIQLDQEPAIIVREPDAATQPTPHDIQLMSKHRVLSFKPQLRLEWRGQDGQNETEQPDRSASLGGSITSSTRIRFSVHTGQRKRKGQPAEKS